MKRVTLIIEDTSLPALVSPFIKKPKGVTVTHFFVECFSWKDFARYIKERRHEKTK